MLPLRAEQLSELLLVLHGIPSRPADITRVQKMCSRYVGARNSTMGICEGRTGKVRFVDYYPEDAGFAREYETRYRHDDPVKSASMLAAPRRFWTRDQLVPEDVIRTHPFFTDWCRKNGYDDVCIARIPIGGDYHCLWAFSRGLDQPGFSRLELDFLESLLPHAEQALGLHNQLDRLGVFADIGQEQLLQSGHGLVLLNEDGNISYLSRIASRLLGEGSAVTAVDGKLCFSDPAVGERFEELAKVCRTAAGTNAILAGGAVAVPRPGSSPMGITVMPFRRQESFPTLIAGAGRVVVTLFDPERPRLDTRTILREMYGLSEIEAEVCWRLGNGETLEEIARETGAARETVRSQLKRSFTKTGTNRQSDLVRLVLLGPAAWSRALS